MKELRKKILFNDINDDVLYEEYNISNDGYYGKNDNTPDNVNFYLNGNIIRLSFVDDICRAFIVMLKNGRYEVVIGKDSNAYHSDLVHDIIKDNVGKETKSFGDFISDLKESIVSFGCYWYIVPSKAFKWLEEPIIIFSFWGQREIHYTYSNKMNLETPFLIEMVKLVIKNSSLPKYCVAYIACGESFFKVDDLGKNTQEIEKTSSLYSNKLHELPAEQKYKLTNLFRINRDKEIGKKLSMYDKNGNFNGEMPVAKYRALKYVDESNGKLNEGAWGYKPSDSDSYWDMTHEVFEPSIKRVIKGLKDRKHDPYCFFGLAIDLLNQKKCMFEMYDELFEMIVEFNKRYNEYISDENNISGWENPKKFKEQLKKVKKEFDEKSKDIVDEIKKRESKKELTETKYSKTDLISDMPSKELNYPYENDNELEHFTKKEVKDGDRIEIYYQFGKNVLGLTKELSKIGKDIENLSKKYYIYLNNKPNFNTVDDVYNLKVVGRLREKNGEYIEEEAKYIKNRIDEMKKCIENTKRVYLTESQLDKIKSKLNENTSNTLKLYHNTTLDNLDSILCDGVIRTDTYHSEGHGDMIWFTTKDDYQNQCKISIEVPKDKLEELGFKWMNSVHITYYKPLNINDFNFKIEKVNVISYDRAMEIFKEGDVKLLNALHKIVEYDTIYYWLLENFENNNSNKIQNLNESENFINQKVLLVKRFLDKAFVHAKMPIIGSDGMPKNMFIVGLKGTDGNIIKNMSANQLFYLVQDKFSKIFGDKEKRDRFLKRVILDWYNNKISCNGLLSTINW